MVGEFIVNLHRNSCGSSTHVSSKFFFWFHEMIKFLCLERISVGKEEPVDPKVLCLDRSTPI